MNFLFRLTTSYSNYKILASEERMKARVKNFGIRNLKKFGIRNPTREARNPQSTMWNPEFATRSDSFTWGELCFVSK